MTVGMSDGMADARRAAPVLRLRNLHVTLASPRGAVQAVRGIDLQLHEGETLALVGESGCGKSVTAQAIAGLLPASAQIRYDDAQCLHQSLNSTQRRALAMVFQNPMATFNPTLTIGYQVAEPLRVHAGLNRHEAEREALRLLSRMAIADAARKAQQYPHEFSGGMLQRAAIAMALAARPQLLIADEPTTALDVSTQREVMQLLRECQQEQQLSVLFITHDLALMSEYADRMAVMYAGQIVEQGDADAVLHSPQHPYTRALLASLPDFRRARGTRLQSISGSPPDLRQPPEGCAFCPRCTAAMRICLRETPPAFIGQPERHGCDKASHSARCWQLHRDYRNPNEPVASGGADD